MCVWGPSRKTTDTQQTLRKRARPPKDNSRSSLAHVSLLCACALHAAVPAGTTAISFVRTKLKGKFCLGLRWLVIITHLEREGYRHLCAGEAQPLLVVRRHPWRRLPPAFSSSTTHASASGVLMSRLRGFKRGRCASGACVCVCLRGQPESRRERMESGTFHNVEMENFRNFITR